MAGGRCLFQYLHFTLRTRVHLFRLVGGIGGRPPSGFHLVLTGLLCEPSRVKNTKRYAKHLWTTLFSLPLLAPYPVPGGTGHKEAQGQASFRRNCEA